MVKLIVCDVDGTLVEDGGSVASFSSEYYDVIRKLYQKGVRFAVCSGRQRVSVEKLFYPVLDLIYLAVDGGSMVFYQGKCVYSKTLPQDVCCEIIEDARKIPQCDVMVCGRERAYATSEDSEMYRWLVGSYGFDVRAVGDLTRNVPDEMVKISLYHRNMVEELTNPWFSPKWKGRVKLNLAGIQWLDCVPKDAGKGTAVEYIQNCLGVSCSETVVFGDNQNDIEMFRRADTSFAVENAREEVKKIATSFCKSYEEDGVLQQLKKILNEI